MVRRPDCFPHESDESTGMGDSARNSVLSDALQVAEL